MDRQHALSTSAVEKLSAMPAARFRNPMRTNFWHQDFPRWPAGSLVGDKYLHCRRPGQLEVMDPGSTYVEYQPLQSVGAIEALFDLSNLEAADLVPQAALRLQQTGDCPTARHKELFHSCFYTQGQARQPLRNIVPRQDPEAQKHR